MYYLEMENLFRFTDNDKKVVSLKNSDEIARYILKNLNINDNRHLSFIYFRSNIELSISEYYKIDKDLSVKVNISNVTYMLIKHYQNNNDMSLCIATQRNNSSYSDDVFRFKLISEAEYVEYMI